MNAPVTRDRSCSSNAVPGPAASPCSRKKIIGSTGRGFGRKPNRAQDGAVKTTTTPHSFTTKSPRSFIPLNSWMSIVLLVFTALIFRVSATPSDRGLAARHDDGLTGLLRRSPQKAGATIYPTPTTTKKKATTGTAKKAAATKTDAPALVVDPSAVESTGIPAPFDSALLSTNLTSDCSSFMKGFLETEDFRACNPLSMLLQTSDAFFTTLQKGAFAISKVIDQTCSSDVDSCSRVMDKYGTSLISEDNCGADYELRNPVVAQAHAGFEAYRALYSAGCMKSDSGNYCYVEAVTNRQVPSDPLIYFLPLGISLAEDAKPNCSKCLKDTMAIFAGSAGNSSQPISKVYKAAAEQINTVCGPNYVQAEVAPVAGSSASSLSPISIYSTFGVLVVVLLSQL